jgi:hypothetical protein
VSIQLPRIVPLGVTVQDCVALPPSEVFAVNVNEFEVRAWLAVGVQSTPEPLTTAPVGPLVKT